VCDVVGHEGATDCETLKLYTEDWKWRRYRTVTNIRLVASRLSWVYCSGVQLIDPEEKALHRGLEVAPLQDCHKHQVGTQITDRKLSGW
jgi:hypothetical protein